MSEDHLAYLNLGSNIQPESNLLKAVELLSAYGEIIQYSQVWESEPVGTTGSNYLNVCIQFKTHFDALELKEQVIHPIEKQLGRERGPNKYTPRSMDIDIILFDNNPIQDKVWDLAFVVVPLADLYPEYRKTKTSESVLEIATRLRREVWLETHRGIID
ncbi:MAG: 2-amino-4-hydroxy-6-hydroxymethyldihydropteridine diphosphokinase [Chloroflexota bacterium]